MQTKFEVGSTVQVGGKSFEVLSASVLGQRSRENSGYRYTHSLGLKAKRRNASRLYMAYADSCSGRVGSVSAVAYV